LEEEFEDRAGVARSEFYRVTRAELFQGYRILVEKVAQSYADCRFAEPLSAVNWDPQKPRRGKTAAAIHFLVDVQRAAEHALRNEPDRPDLIRRFLSMANSPTRLDEAERRMIEKLGPVFRGRGLSPSRYFVPNRHVQRRGIESLPDSMFLSTATAMAEIPE